MDTTAELQPARSEATEQQPSRIALQDPIIPSFTVQAHALMRKNWTYQKRSWKTNACLVAFPIFLCLVLLAIQLVTDYIFGGPAWSCGCACVFFNPPPAPCQRVCSPLYSNGDQAPQCQVPSPATIPNYMQVPYPDYRAVDFNGDFPGYAAETCRDTNTCPFTILYTGGTRATADTMANYLFNKKVPSDAGSLLTILTTIIPGTPSIPPSSMLVDPAVYQSWYTLQDNCATFTDLWGINQQCVNVLPVWRANELSINSDLYRGYQKGNSDNNINEIVVAYDFHDTTLLNLKLTVYYNATFRSDITQFTPCIVRVTRSLNLAAQAFLQMVSGAAAELPLWFIKDFPKTASVLKLNLAALLGPLFFMWVVQLLFPFTISGIVYEKQQNLRTMMKMHGLGDGPYLFITYAYFVAISLIYFLCFVAFGSAIGLQFFRINDYSIQFVFYIIYANTQIAFAFVLSCFFTQVSTATVVGYLYVFGFGLLGDFPYRGSKCFQILDLCDRAYTCFYAVSWAVRVCSRIIVDFLKRNDDPSYSIVCDELKKVYAGVDGNPDKHAVRSLSLAIKRGECFGMLGPNGAGKTTSIHMMTGFLKPSSGSIVIQGLDISKDMDKIYTLMGVCPQHDLIWETLTGREHLQFYGRLKNMTGLALENAVDLSLKSVNLYNGGVGDKQAGRYSGGMKRRLSVAISFMGNPKVYMDEPSTGLDPASRVHEITFNLGLLHHQDTFVYA